MNKYHESKIYKIICDDYDKIYIGSTVQPLYTRFSYHKGLQNNTGSKELFNYPNTRIELLERYECNCKKELVEREQYYINLNKDICLNKIRAFTDEEQGKKLKKEYYLKTQDKQINRSKEYYKNNKEDVLIKCKEYRILNFEQIEKRRKTKMTCECGIVIKRYCYFSHNKTNKHIELMKLKNN
jgi:hypothetical protein